MAKRSQLSKPAAGGRRLRCAIYARKSTEEGLDQEFNSLDAQREACAAYILSQRHEGWTLLPELYDDGGYSGGNMERPGLKRLMAEVHAGRVDVIVVYKVDRLTRSLTDFAKIVDVFDGAGASFVSITQSFNTTSSMGRLTLNVLLSFAQFEREVISERVRDKVAASKAKGMWMGGRVPMGYDAIDRKLIPNEEEAKVLRHIMQRYLDLGSVPALIADLKASNIHNKPQILTDGSTRGGGPFEKGGLYHLMRNRIYIGEITHKDKIYPGEHEAILDRTIFDAVQAMLEKNAAERRRGDTAAHPSLLAGMIRDGYDRPMSPSHATKGRQRYRYYVSNIHMPGEADASTPAIRLPALVVEKAIVDAVAASLEAAEPIRARWQQLGSSAMDTALRRCRKLADQLASSPTAEKRHLLITLDLQAIIDDSGVAASISLERLLKQIGVPADDADQIERAPVAVPTKFKNRGNEVRMVFAPIGARPAKRDPKLIALLVQAEAARQQLIDGAETSGPDAAEARRDLTRFARLAYLAPDIMTAILDGRQPEDFGPRQLKRAGRLPLEWNEQRKVLGFT